MSMSTVGEYNEYSGECSVQGRDITSTLNEYEGKISKIRRVLSIDFEPKRTELHLYPSDPCR